MSCCQAMGLQIGATENLPQRRQFGAYGASARADRAIRAPGGGDDLAELGDGRVEVVVDDGDAPSSRGRRSRSAAALAQPLAGPVVGVAPPAEAPLLLGRGWARRRRRAGRRGTGSRLAGALDLDLEHDVACPAAASGTACRGGCRGTRPTRGSPPSSIRASNVLAGRRRRRRRPPHPAGGPGRPRPAQPQRRVLRRRAARRGCPCRPRRGRR